MSAEGTLGGRETFPNVQYNSRKSAGSLNSATKTLFLYFLLIFIPYIGRKTAKCISGLEFFFGNSHFFQRVEVLERTLAWKELSQRPLRKRTRTGERVDE